MGAPRIFIDTGAIYAFVTRSDRNHPAARSFVERWLGDHGAFLLLDSVFAETMTLLKVRLGVETAIRVGRALRADAAYVWTTLGQEGERETWGLFQKHRDKDWSYTDCSLLAMSVRTGIRGIFAFDPHFSQMREMDRQPRK